VNRNASTLVIACGALAHEITALQRINQWSHLAVQCLPADWHNTPEKITPGVAARIAQARAAGFEHLFVAYADCGTGGQLDALLEREGVERLPGAHCYGFFAGDRLFDELNEAALGSFYLTDFLLRHFDRLVIRGLGLDRHPELLPVYFGNYTHLVYLAQRESPDGRALGEAAARRLGLRFTYRLTGYGELETGLRRAAAVRPPVEVTWQN
jgi:Protein of unknown function (DUF1638)